MGDPVTGQPVTSDTTSGDGGAATATATATAAGGGLPGEPGSSGGAFGGGYAGSGGSGGGFGGSGGSFGAGSGSGGGLPAGEYGGGGAGGGNPLVVQAQETSTGLSGLRLVEDGQDVIDALETDSWVDDALAGFGTAADAVALALDPIGEVLGTAIGWAIEHLDPLRTWLYELTGHPGQVAAGAQTWANISTRLSGCSVDLTDSVRVRLAGQESVAVGAYKSFQLDNAARLSLAACLSGGISAALTVASTIVQVVHDMVRDAIADVLAKLTTKLAITLVTGGVAAIWAAPSLIADVSKWAIRLQREVTAAVKSAANLGEVFKRANTLMDSLSDGLRSAAPHPATAMATAGSAPRAPRASRSSSTPSHPKGGSGGTGRDGGSGKGAGGGRGAGGGKSTGSGSGGGPHKPRPVDPAKTKKAQEAQKRADQAADKLPPHNRERKTTSSDHAQALSGWSQKRPSGFQKPNIDEVFAKQKEIGHPTKPADFADNGVPGQYYASHAERQLSITAVEREIGVSKPVCPDCQQYFSRLAQYEGKDWYVADPDGGWVFRSDGSTTRPDGTITPP